MPIEMVYPQNWMVLSKIVFVVLIVFMFIYVLRQYSKHKCSSVDIAPITGISKRDDRFNFKFRDFYIKSSYNSCATGQFKNDWVDLCSLTNVIKQGYRVLDFEVYLVDNKAVVATSNSTKFTEKGTYNSIPIEDVIQLISTQAVSTSMTTDTCPNAFDPLILHFRIKSNHLDVYNQIADALVKYLDSKLLPNEYSYENKGHNLGMVDLKTFLGKVIIMVDKIENNHIRGTKLEELVNTMGSSAFLRSLPYNEVIHTPDMDELIEFNKKNMTIAYPNLSYQSTNYNSSIIMQYGVQMGCMCAQTNDTFLQAYNTLFNQAGTAFLLKPANLRYVQVTVEEPPPIDPALSYGYKTHETNYYNFNL
jgi:hypothetical protein